MKKVNYREIGNWDVQTHHDVGADGRRTADTQRIIMCVLLVIRDEIKRLNALLHCPNFQAIPRKLDRISRNTAKPRKRRATNR